MSSRRRLPISRNNNNKSKSSPSPEGKDELYSNNSYPIIQDAAFSPPQDEDERIRILQNSGALSHVVGSQSILSQELQMEYSLQQGNLPPFPPYGPVPHSMLLTQPYQQQQQFQPPAPAIKEQPAPAPTVVAANTENGESGSSSSQLGNLLTAAKKIETPLPSPTKKKKPSPTNAAKLPPQTLEHSTKRRTRKVSKSKQEKIQQDEQARALAQQAANLAAQAISNPEISKSLLLKMVFSRINPRSPPASWPPPGHTIEEGFFWATYPPLEHKLKSFMPSYYELSMSKCQSKEQQAFNNDMVIMIRAEAAKYQWTFSPNFSEKALRDRVRCYFKTHIQNAKKRLRTMLMNPTKKANTRALVEHLHLIQTQVCDIDENDKPLQQEQQQQQDVMALGFSQLSQDSHVAKEIAQV